MMWKILHYVVPNGCDLKFNVTPRHGDVAIIYPHCKSKVPYTTSYCTTGLLQFKDRRCRTRSLT